MGKVGNGGPLQDTGPSEEQLVYVGAWGPGASLLAPVVAEQNALFSGLTKKIYHTY